ncbi:MAG: magnesium transporter [Bacteroidetes bacterium RBG_13_42_15]|nr:MAG: magnesium transporter [Bacteroidetes bacterium RBG_13_42_15]
MITYWKNGTGLHEISSPEKNCWINVVNPSQSEIEILTGKWLLPIDIISDILDVDERSRMEIDNEWLALILRIPVYNKDNGIPYDTIPFGIILLNDYVVTICISGAEMLSEITTPARNKKVDFENKINFILHIFLFSAKIYLRYLKQINTETTAVEKELVQSTRNKELQKLLRMEKCLVHFITSLKSNELLLSQLRNSKFFKVNEFNEDLLEDVIIENKQAVEMANIYSDIQSSMMDAFASVISNNMNVVIKQLTSITILLMIPTLIASFYGMNIPNYLESSKHGFALVVILSIMLSGIGLFFFWKKRWF